ncbi:DNA polymerase Y family protein [Rhizobium sp. L1K21]|nr:DNA polymerase Y family protein [Rhizobium sp. L1K21]
MRLCAMDEAAEAAGLKLGQGVTEARACIPETEVIEATPNADRAFLNGLADWCGRYTPLVATHGNDSLFLDITGCTHLFGGEHAMLRDILSRLFHMGLDTRASISSSPGLSFALAHSGQQKIVETGHEAEALTPLPLSALRLEEETLAALSRSGLKIAGHLIGAPRAPLARRFGSHVLRRLDQALGIEEETISPRLPVARFSAERQIPEPITGEDDILALAGQLAATLEKSFDAHGLGGQMFELALFRVDGHVARLNVKSADPLKEPARIARLFRERLAGLHDDLEAGFGFEMIRLSAGLTAPFNARQRDFMQHGKPDLPIADFAARVEARLGEALIHVPAMHESHIPERASRLAPFSGATPPAAATLPALIRPVRLFQYPEPVEAMAEVPEGPPITFRWRRAQHRVRRAEGPERIEAEWWIDGTDTPPRDYFRIEDEKGHRFWLYREGLYGRTPLPPRWFMHGVFA